MDRHGDDCACHHPSDLKQKMVRGAFQGQVHCLSGFVHCSEYTAAPVVYADGFFRDVDERICGAFYVRTDGRRPCQKNAPFHVALVLCPDGAAPWPACPGDGSKVEAVGQKEIFDFGNLLRHRRNRLIPLSSKRNAGLSVLPGPVCFPGL